MNAPPPAAHDDRDAPRRPERRHQQPGRRHDDEEMRELVRREHEEAERLKEEKRRAERWALAKPIIATALGFLTAEAWNAATTNRWREEVDVRVANVERGMRSLQRVRCLDPYTSETMLVASEIDCDAISRDWREIRENEVRRLRVTISQARPPAEDQP